MPNLFRPSTWLRSPRDVEPAVAERTAGRRTLIERLPADRIADGARIAHSERSVLQRIEERAYYKWREAGCPAGSDMEHWLAAEAEVLEELQRPRGAREM